MKKYFYTYENIHGLVVEKIPQFKDFDVVVGISRGGLLPSLIISQHKKIPLIPLTWQTRDGHTQDVQGLVSILNNYNKILIVDDINDTGLTLTQIDSIVSKYTKEVTYYTVVKKPLTNFTKSIYSEVVDNDFWIVFPWECLYEI